MDAAAELAAAVSADGAAEHVHLALIVKAAAVVYGVVFGDRAAVYGQVAAVPVGDAAAGCVRLVAGHEAAVHHHLAGVVDAAAGGSRLVVADDDGVFHGHLAGVVHAAAALFIGTLVVGNHAARKHGGAVRGVVYAAALAAGRIAGDRAVNQVEPAGRMDAAAELAAAVSADGAAEHVHLALIVKAAAVVYGVVFGDRAAVYGQVAAVPVGDAAAGCVRLVAGHEAAVHHHLAGVVDAAAGVYGFVAADGAAV